MLTIGLHFLKKSRELHLLKAQNALSPSIRMSAIQKHAVPVLRIMALVVSSVASNSSRNMELLATE